MTPGPVPVPSTVLKKLALPMIHHRTPEFEEILTRALAELKTVFRTKLPVMILTSTGSGAMEAAIVNTLSPGDEVLCVDSGKFGERWAQIAESYGVQVHRHKIPWGEALKPKEIEKILRQCPSIKAVLTQVCETSTATLHPIEELAQTLRQFPHCLFMVDAITAIGATPLAMDDWGLDVVVAGSQKAFMLPTGISFITLSEKAWKAQQSARCPRFYWDLKREREANEKNQTYFSSAVGLIRALEEVLGQFQGSGLNKSIRRCEKLAQATRLTSGLLGLEVFSQSPAPSVTALTVPANINGEKLRDHLESQYAISVMGGQDQLKGKVIRIGHLGAISDQDMLATIKALGLSLRDLGSTSLTTAQIQKAVQLCKKTLRQK